MVYTDMMFFQYNIKKPEIPPCAPMGAEWADSCKQQWWGSARVYTDDASIMALCNYPAQFEEIKTTIKLRDKLLSFGGHEACMALTDPDHKTLLTDRARLWGGKSTMKRGRPGQCHMNSSYCWDANRNVTRICTGYALSSDGMWREHSWVVNLYETQSGRLKMRVVETTEKRVAYFGYIMTTEECERFFYEND